MHEIWAGPARTLQQVLPGKAGKEGVHEGVACAARQAAQPRGWHAGQPAPNQVLAGGQAVPSQRAGPLEAFICFGGFTSCG